MKKTIITCDNCRKECEYPEGLTMVLSIKDTDNYVEKDFCNSCVEMMGKIFRQEVRSVVSKCPKCGFETKKAYIDNITES